MKRIHWDPHPRKRRNFLIEHLSQRKEVKQELEMDVQSTKNGEPKARIVRQKATIVKLRVLTSVEATQSLKSQLCQG